MGEMVLGPDGRTLRNGDNESRGWSSAGGGPLPAAVVAAVAAALAAHFEHQPGRRRLRSIRPVQPGPDLPNLWNWAGRRDLMAGRSSMRR
ncbi:MAG: hypothetical protein WD535_04450 [Thermaerobacterales bacterium]